MAFAETFKALSDPVRREILVLLKKEKLSASFENSEEGRSDTGNEIQEFHLLRAEYFCGGRADALAVRLERGFNIMKENKSKVIITSIVTVFPMVIGFLLWNRLPEKIATHFGSEGADGWSTKLFAVVIFPLILLVIHLFCLGVTLNDPKKKNIGRAMMTLIFWIVPVLSVVSNLSIYGYALGMDVNMEVIVSILMGGIFILLGNYMSKNHQNYTVGIKLPWTLNSEENWNRTHRMAGKLWILAGLVFWGSVFFENNTVPIVIIVVVVTIPMIYSFVLYKKGI